MNERQYHLINNELILYVKKSPLAIRLFIYLLTVISIVFPFVPIALDFMEHGEIKAGPVMIGLFLIVIAIYFVRMSLWNTYGAERITFGKEKLEYIADYKWFKDGAQELENYTKLYCSYMVLQEKKSSMGRLGFIVKDKAIHCVTKLPLTEIEEIIEKLSSLEIVSFLDADDDQNFK
ncbi:hypothetical protein N9B82_03485 [Saprospiraceae bacterium]|nr:hypothetical protein [Saprospiraceae bacterium]